MRTRHHPIIAILFAALVTGAPLAVAQQEGDQSNGAPDAGSPTDAPGASGTTGDLNPPLGQKSPSDVEDPMSGTSGMPQDPAGASVAVQAHPRQPAPPDARVRIIWPSDGQVIKGGKFWLRMGTSNIGVAPAGVQKPKTAHHHLLIDVADLPLLDQPIPNNNNHLHFGGGQTEVRIELPPGQHTLQLLAGDAEHVPHDPPLMSKKITVTVP